MTAVPLYSGSAQDLFLQHVVVSSNDRDHARHVLSDTFLPLELEPLHPSKPMDVKLNVVKVGQLTAGYLRFAEAVRIRTVEAESYHIDIPIYGQALVRSGLRDPVFSTPGNAGVFTPGLPAQLDWGRGTGQICLMVPRQALKQEIERILGHPVGDFPEFGSALDLMGLAGRALLRTLRVIDHESRAGGMLEQPLGEQSLEQALLDAILFAVPHSYSEAIAESRPRLGRRSIARAMELLRSSPDTTWSVSALAAEVSISVRSIQEGFRTSTGVSPMRYLREIRLERAHEDLAAAEPGSVSVAQVAGRWGFVHLGRFAVEYRSRYLESPSVTLRSYHLC